MELVVKPDGSLQCLYAEQLDLTTLGPVTIRRASHVEPDDQGRWRAAVGPTDLGIWGCPITPPSRTGLFAYGPTGLKQAVLQNS